MSNHTPPLYALVPITETEGLKEGVFYELYIPDFLGLTHWGKNKLEAGGKWRVDPPEGSFYLRPLPEGMVAVSREELERRHKIIMSEPNGIVRDTMIAELLFDLF